MAGSADRPDGWVEAPPFRAWLRQLVSDTGLPWRVIARAAGVSPLTTRNLLRGTGSHSGWLRHRDAVRLFELTPSRLVQLDHEPGDCARLRALVWTLGIRGCSAVEVAEFIGSDGPAVRRLMSGAEIWCSRLMVLRAEAACQAWGVDVAALPTARSPVAGAARSA